MRPMSSHFFYSQEYCTICTRRPTEPRVSNGHTLFCLPTRCHSDHGLPRDPSCTLKARQYIFLRKHAHRTTILQYMIDPKHQRTAKHNCSTHRARPHDRRVPAPAGSHPPAPRSVQRTPSQTLSRTGSPPRPRAERPENAPKRASKAMATHVACIVHTTAARRLRLIQARTRSGRWRTLPCGQPHRSGPPLVENKGRSTCNLRSCARPRSTMTHLRRDEVCPSI